MTVFDMDEILADVARMSGMSNQALDEFIRGSFLEYELPKGSHIEPTLTAFPYGGLIAVTTLNLVPTPGLMFTAIPKVIQAFAGAFGVPCTQRDVDTRKIGITSIYDGDCYSQLLFSITPGGVLTVDGLEPGLLVSSRDALDQQLGVLYTALEPYVVPHPGSGVVP